MRSKSRPTTQFGVCIDNRGYAASLEVGKLYRVIPDVGSSRRGYIRVVDESGEDYGYSAERFFVLKVPQPVARALGRRPERSVDRLNRVMLSTAAKMRRS